MEKYRKTLKTRMALLIIVALIGVAVGIYDVFFASETVKESFMFGFQAGAATALAILSVIVIIRYRVILNDETKLKLKYNEENDERLKAIRAKAGLPTILYTSIGIVVAAIIAGYFNPTVFVALCCAACGQMLAAAIIKRIYLKKI